MNILTTLIHELIAVFQCLSVPFVLTDQNVPNIFDHVTEWTGHVSSSAAGVWFDLLVAMVS